MNNQTNTPEEKISKIPRLENSPSGFNLQEARRKLFEGKRHWNEGYNTALEDVKRELSTFDDDFNQGIAEALDILRKVEVKDD